MVLLLSLPLKLEMTLFVAIGPYLGALVESFETFAWKRTLKHSKKGPSHSSITEPGRGTEPLPLKRALLKGAPWKSNYQKG